MVLIGDVSLVLLLPCSCRAGDVRDPASASPNRWLILNCTHSPLWLLATRTV